MSNKYDKLSLPDIYTLNELFTKNVIVTLVDETKIEY